MTLDFDTDSFLKLLTDALRAGPGSPEWHEAVAAVRVGADAPIALDELKLIVAAREHLESGRAYRSVRPGPGFTADVMRRVDEERDAANEGVAKRRRFSLAAWGVLGGVLLISLAVGGYAWKLASVDKGAGEELAKLESVTFAQTLSAVDFDDGMPPDWKQIGSAALVTREGLRLARPTTRPTTAPTMTSPTVDTIGGGLVWPGTAGAGKPFTVAANLRVGQVGDDLAAEIAITDRPDFATPTATGSHELVTTVQGGQTKILLPAGSLAAQTERAASREVVSLRVTIGPTQAIVEVNGKRLWAGPHGLANAGQRYVVVRFIRRGVKGADGVAFRSVMVVGE